MYTNWKDIYMKASGEDYAPTEYKYLGDPLVFEDLGLTELERVLTTNGLTKHEQVVHLYSLFSKALPSKVERSLLRQSLDEINRLTVFNQIDEINQVFFDIKCDAAIENLSYPKDKEVRLEKLV